MLSQAPWYAILFTLFIGHALADYPLQGDWLSKAKNPTLSLVPGERIWVEALACHGLIHAGAVWLVTGSLILGAFEFFSHCLIDYAKCRKVINYTTDQWLHIWCKGLWVSLLFYWG